MLFSDFSAYLQRIELMSSRLEMTSLLAELFGKLDPAEVRIACYMMQGTLRPSYEPGEFQISSETVLKVLAQLLPVEKEETDSLFGDLGLGAEREVEMAYQKLGDLGLVAENTRAASAEAARTCSLQDIYSSLSEIAAESGTSSQQRKQAKLLTLLRQSNPVSAKFIVRMVLGSLRLGFSDMTMIDALSWRMTGSKDERAALELAYQKKADIGKLAETYLSEADPHKRQLALKHYALVEVGSPVIPALCQRLNSAAEMIEKMGRVKVESKYDGLRVQIHYSKGTKDRSPLLRTFTRNLEESTAMFPELQSAVEYLQCTSCILDAEAIGYDPASGELLPFQQTTQRKRKHGVLEKAQEIPVRFYVFDILLLDGKECIEQSLTERKRLLAGLFDANSYFMLSPTVETTEASVIHELHEQFLAEGLEGVVVKQCSAPYQSGRKGWSWVKMKEAEGTSGKLADTLDVIVMGYYLGRGKWAEFGMGALLVGVRDDEDHVVTIAKVGSGLSEELLVTLKRICDGQQASDQPRSYLTHKQHQPDVWCLPGLVVEVAADELTNSPIHTAGFALRFPRILRVRDDKRWQQATTLTEVRQLVEMQG